MFLFQHKDDILIQDGINILNDKKQYVEVPENIQSIDIQYSFIYKKEHTLIGGEGIYYIKDVKEFKVFDWVIIPTYDGIYNVQISKKERIGKYIKYTINPLFYKLPKSYLSSWSSNEKIHGEIELWKPKENEKIIVYRQGSDSIEKYDSKIHCNSAIAPFEALLLLQEQHYENR